MLMDSSNYSGKFESTTFTGNEEEIQWKKKINDAVLIQDDGEIEGLLENKFSWINLVKDVGERCC